MKDEGLAESVGQIVGAVASSPAGEAVGQGFSAGDEGEGSALKEAGSGLLGVLSAPAAAFEDKLGYSIPHLTPAELREPTDDSANGVDPFATQAEAQAGGPPVAPTCNVPLPQNLSVPLRTPHLENLANRSGQRVDWKNTRID